eukprot:Blabericola_migrator_1__5199@NODE_267_length_10594_cov_56_602451_g223_i0_p6_GENE_NODE_267_length_10594_cov_56_602451_g223_i0NODE_267_length_10594_cov_56_602451_g223_i0_p6_ORF_typecomplete_len246_score25_23_NODE_267_length_10594_cov_56_602451_g223_i033304067
MQRLMALLLVPAVSTELTVRGSYNIYSDECPESCRKQQFSSPAEVRACNDDAAANASSACLFVGAFGTSGEDTITYVCNKADSQYRYYTATLPLLQNVPGTLSDARATLISTDGLKANCNLYTAPLLPTVSDATCNINKAKVDLNGTPYISALRNATMLILPVGFTQPRHLVAAAADTGCDLLNNTKAKVAADCVLKIIGEDTIASPEDPSEKPSEDPREYSTENCYRPFTLPGLCVVFFVLKSV